LKSAWACANRGGKKERPPFVSGSQKQGEKGKSGGVAQRRVVENRKRKKKMESLRGGAVVRRGKGQTGKNEKKNQKTSGGKKQLAPNAGGGVWGRAVGAEQKTRKGERESWGEWRCERSGKTKKKGRPSGVEGWGGEKMRLCLFGFPNPETRDGCGGNRGIWEKKDEDTFPIRIKERTGFSDFLVGGEKTRKRKVLRENDEQDQGGGKANPRRGLSK